jgi:hypothetical protein
MEAVSSATVANASAADPGTVAGAASLLVLKKALNMQASSAAQVIQALQQPALATSGALGTRVNTFV